MIKFKKCSSIITGMSLIISLAGNAISVHAEENEGILDNTKKIDILSFNDFHGSVLESGKNIGAAKLTSIIKEYKINDAADDTYGVLAVSGGDNYQGSAMSNLTEGAPVNDMLKEMEIEASAIGNHEYDWGRDKIKSWASEGDFDFVAANVVYEGTDSVVDYAVPYVISESEGINVAFIGIATPETLTSTKAENVEGIEFLDPVQTLDKWSHIVREEGADVVIALTHCGASNDAAGNVIGEAAEIAENAADINGVIAAHNHAFTSGMVNGRPVVEGGYNGRGLGIISLTLDEEKNIVDAAAATRKLYEESATIVPDETIANKVTAYENQMEPILGEEVTDLKFDLSHDRYAGITPLGIQVSEAMRQIGKTQIGIANGGGIRTSLSAGKLTVGDMYTILPFDNQLVTLDLKGSDLKEVIEHGINPETFGWGQFAGLKVWYDSNTDKVIKMQLEDGTEVKDYEYYSVTTIDFLITGGDYYDFSKAINVKDTFEVMREGIQQYWKEQGIVEMDYDLLVAVNGSEIPEEEKPEVSDEEKEPEISGEEEKPEVSDEEKEPEISDEEKEPEISGEEEKPEVSDEEQKPQILGQEQKPAIKPGQDIVISRPNIDIIENYEIGKNNHSVKVDVVKENSLNDKEKNQDSMLPKTGAKVSSVSAGILGLVLLTAGVMMIKRREKRA